MSTLINEVDARTKLAGANRMELLLFHVGSAEVFGINVFKVREVMKLPAVTRVPEADARIQGMANIRGTMVPVIDLKAALGLGEKVPDDDQEDGRRGNLIVTEYNGSLQAFRVSGVDRIVRISWNQIATPPRLVSEHNRGTITSVTTLEDGRLVLIVDVEKILNDMCPRTDDELYAGLEPSPKAKAKCILFADDSSVARTQIRKTLERLGVGFLQTATGKEAWEALERLAREAANTDRKIDDYVQVILSDIEMPDMDGFTLTKQIRSDPRFAHLPVILHSSLTGSCNVTKGKSVGATDYVTKFDPRVLGETLLRHL